jgi:hypothetical protein
MWVALIAGWVSSFVSVVSTAPISGRAIKPETTRSTATVIRSVRM